MEARKAQNGPLIRAALLFAMVVSEAHASSLRVSDKQASSDICQLQVLSSAQEDIVTNCGSKNAVIKEWNECRNPIMEVAQRRIKNECCKDAVGVSGCDDASLPTEVYEADSPGAVPINKAEDDSPA